VVNGDARFPVLKPLQLKPFLVQNIFADFKRHDLSPNFHERNYDGTIRTQFLTAVRCSTSRRFDRGVVAQLRDPLGQLYA
jgi:hypothetical protein